MKTIWIVNYYSVPPEFDTHLRHLEFARYLSFAGYNVRIIGSSFIKQENLQLIHNMKLLKNAIYGEYHFTHIKSCKYQGNGLRRIFSIIQFAINVLLVRHKIEKPDVILHNIHAPFDYPISWCAKLLHARYIVEAWDLWPDSFVRFGLISGKNPLVLLAYDIERRMYKEADAIIFSFEGGLDYLKQRKWTLDTGGSIDEEKVFYINNGIDIEKFNADKRSHIIDDDDLSNNNFFKVVYLGSIQLVNNLQQLIDSANILKDDKRFKFLIYGDGSERKVLEEYCKNNCINNVYFKQKRIPIEYVPYVVSSASINVLNYKKDFGIFGVSPGKLFQYLAAGKPICSNIRMNYSIIKKYNLGIEDDMNTPKKYADSIRSIADLCCDDYLSMCNRVVHAASEFDYKVLSSKLIEVLKFCNIVVNGLRDL